MSAPRPAEHRRRAGIVVIGRNEGSRLRTCLEAVRGLGVPVVYVDSGSSDGSADLGRAMGAEVLELDPARPFSAARARNEGAALLAAHAGVEVVQFLDGDCELFPGWLDRGLAELDRRPGVAALCGRVRERHPDASIYNRLCGIEWQMTPGEVEACGGVFLARLAAFREVGGFRPEVVAGEEPEFCLRLRRAGHTVIHLAEDMAWHDSAMIRFGQWWQRARRAGLAYAQGAALHGRSPDRHYVRDCLRIWLWGLALPLVAVGLAAFTGGAGLALLLAYPLQVMRVARAGRRRGLAPADARLDAFFAVLAKFPGLQGMLGFHWRQLRGSPITIIEHKVKGAPDHRP